MTVKRFLTLGAVLAVTTIGFAGCSTTSPGPETADQRLSRQIAIMRLAEHQGGVSGSAHDRGS